MTVLLDLPARVSGYGATLGVGFVSADLDGGAGYRRADFEGATHRVSVQWTVDEEEEPYLQAFYRVRMGRGLPFLINLKILDNGLQQYTAYLVEGSFRLSLAGDVVLTYSAELEVEPMASSDAFDTALIELFPIYGEGMSDLLLLIEELVNINFPEAL